MDIHWSPRAVSDYLNILEYLELNWGTKAVQSFGERIDYILELIISNPRLFIASGKQKDIRRCVITPHTSLFYRQRNQRIELIAFIDNRSDPKKRPL